ncbi:MAG: flagellar assembly protein H, partial [Symploca sp. SIO2E6]|nr:flagellar assembly protein H [Symploca sp. SIO2E6]
MTRTPFDQFSKQLLEEFLSPLGKVERSFEIPGEPRQVDIYFIPQPNQSTTALPSLGLLGKIATIPCLIEPFRNPPSVTEIRKCLLKLFMLQANLEREAQRDNISIPEAQLPHLWILTPSASKSTLKGFGAYRRKSWPNGIYHLHVHLKATMIVIHQLPKTRKTLWLRLLGKGRVQGEAISELLALPDSEPLRLRALQLLANWKIALDYTGTNEPGELAMQLTQVYLEWEQKTKRQGSEAKQREIALKLLELGLSIELVAQGTDLSLEQVQQ